MKATRESSNNRFFQGLQVFWRSDNVGRALATDKQFRQATGAPGPPVTRAAPLISPPVLETAAEVVDRMKLIDAALPTTDGVAWFNKLYLRTTEEVIKKIDDDFFTDAAFMERLDVVFANLYFQAILNSEDEQARVPRAWAPLFQARAERSIAPIQFALAGMNAHINRDLPIAVIDTCRGLNETPDRQRHDDYTRVNAVLEETEKRVKKWFATGFTGVLDEVFGNVDDVVAIWSLTNAREAAWTNAETLWLLQDFPDLEASFLLTLDRMVGFAGRGLLAPTALL